MKYTFLVEMVNPEDVVEIEITAESENARDAFFKAFIQHKDDRYFTDKKTNKSYNKEFIYSYKLKGE